MYLLDLCPRWRTLSLFASGITGFDQRNHVLVSFECVLLLIDLECRAKNFFANRATERYDHGSHAHRRRRGSARLMARFLENANLHFFLLI